ncbi:Bro-N domain-containing protein [Streptomyces phaeolivaceus]|uniref:Bro-N domain-containing protein n=1 Tax=Streptomyces phaeolivaceus TaxID=2653200 RepID=A0A5P8K733_9ACTN|nr:Bro-N domain-containing protein [Streptomyces phaeolivaceus]QFQ98816.1 Bro-N domain-containing protein [Streptomyces phaeolivaceus]
MHEQNNTPPEEPTAHQDAIDINDFVFAATGARIRRLTTPDGEHWFVAADVATDLGYANTRQALIWHVAPDCAKRLNEIAQGVYTTDTSRKLADHRLQRSMKMVNLRGLIALVNGCSKPECTPFKTWVSEVIATIQRDGSYSLEPSPVQPTPTGTTAYAMPPQVADAIVRLEERNIRADEMLTAFQEVRNDLLRDISRSLRDIAQALRHPADSPRPSPAPELTPRQLLANWKAKNLVVTDDVHTVAAYLAPALLHGGAAYRVEEIATRTGLSQERVRHCMELLFEQGCVRPAGRTVDSAPVFVLP